MRFLPVIFFLLIPLLLFSQKEDDTISSSYIYNLEESELALLSDKSISTEKKIADLTKLAHDLDAKGQRALAMRKIMMALALEEEAPGALMALARLHITFGDYLIDAGAPDIGIQHSKKALEYMSRIDTINRGSVYNMTGKVASYYMLVNNYDSALYYFTSAVEEAKRSGESLWEPAAYNNLGILYSRFKQPVLAREYYEKAKQVLTFHDRGDTILMVSILDNIAELEIAELHYAEAILVYQEKLALSELAHMPDQYLRSEFGISRAYLLMNKPAEALKHLNICEGIKSRHTVNLDRQITLQELWQQYYELKGNWKAVYESQKWITTKRDSLTAQKTEFLNEVMQALTASELSKFKKTMEVHKLQLVQKEQELKGAEQEARSNKTLAFVLSILAVIFISLVYLFFRNRNRIQKNRSEIKRYQLELSETNLKNQLETNLIQLDLTEANLKNRELEKEKLQLELENRKNDLSDLALYLANLKEANTKMIERLNEAKGKKPAEQKELISEISSEMLAQLSSDKKTSLIQENIALINKEFYDKLLGMFPDLTKSELELCGFFRLNMSNKEIAVIKNISPESVKMARYRLRKKLNLQPDEDIYKALLSF